MSERQEHKRRYNRRLKLAALRKAGREQAEKLAALRAEKEAAEKALVLAAPEMAVFKTRFERVQKDLMELVRSVDGLPEDKRGGAWKALAALIETAKSECAGVEAPGNG